MNSFNLLLPELAEKFTVYALDLPGFGNSTCNLTLTTKDYARVVDVGYSVNKIKFLNNQFMGVSEKSELIYCNSYSDSNNLIQNNLFRDGAFGIYQIHHGRRVLPRQAHRKTRTDSNHSLPG